MARRGRIDDAALAHGLAQSAQFSFGRTSEDVVRSLPMGKAAPLPCSSAAVSERSKGFVRGSAVRRAARN